jgi:hypothetical protein
MNHLLAHIQNMGALRAFMPHRQVRHVAAPSFLEPLDDGNARRQQQQDNTTANMLQTLAQANASAISFMRAAPGLVASSTFLPVHLATSGTLQLPAQVAATARAAGREWMVYTCTITSPELGFTPWKRRNSIVRVYNVDHSSEATTYAAGICDGHCLALVEGRDARIMRKRELLELLRVQRPVTVTCQDDRHATTARELEQRRQQALDDQHQQFSRSEREQLLRRVRRRLVADNSRDDLVRYLVQEHARGQPLSPHHLFLEYGEQCSHCGFATLLVEQIMKTKSCCLNGACLADEFMPQLEPLPPFLASYLTTSPNELSHHSLKLNQMLNVAAIALSPSRAEGGVRIDPLRRGPTAKPWIPRAVVLAHLARRKFDRTSQVRVHILHACVLTCYGGLTSIAHYGGMAIVLRFAAG